MKQEPVVIQDLGSTEGDFVFRVIRPWTINVSENKPPVTLCKGDFVRLTSQAARENFSIRRILPVGDILDHPQNYECVWPFKLIQAGVYVNIERGDQLEMSWSEAYDLLLRKKIKPISYELFSGGVR